MDKRPRGPNSPPKLAVVDAAYAAAGGSDPARIPIRPPGGIELTKAQQQLWDDLIAPNPFLTLRSSLKAYQFVEMSARYLAAPAAFTAAMIAQLDRLSSDLYVDDAAVYRKERSQGAAENSARATASRFLSKRKPSD